MAHTPLDSSFSIWFSSAVNAVVSSAQKSCLLPHCFPSPQGWGMVCPHKCTPNPSAACFPKGVPVLLWIWSLEVPVWNLNTQQLILTAWVVLIWKPKDFFLGWGQGRIGEEAQTKQKLKPVTNWLKGSEQFQSHLIECGLKLKRVIAFKTLHCRLLASSKH